MEKKTVQKHTTEMKINTTKYLYGDNNVTEQLQK